MAETVRAVHGVVGRGDMKNDTSATGTGSCGLGGWIVPQWFVDSKPPPEPMPRWGSAVGGVRMYDSEGDADEYNDIRYGTLPNGRLVIGVDGDFGYAFVDVKDLLNWARPYEENGLI